MSDLNRLADLLLPGIRNAQLKLEEVSNYLSAMPNSLRHYGGWQPIETAPKDGTRILAYGKHGLDVDEQKWATVVWQDYSKGFVCDPNEATEYDPEVSNITHWMPLPEKPND